MNNESTAKALNAIRFISADGVQVANSGHTGLPMGAAALVYDILHHLEAAIHHGGHFFRIKFLAHGRESGYVGEHHRSQASFGFCRARGQSTCLSLISGRL